MARLHSREEGQPGEAASRLPSSSLLAGATAGETTAEATATTHHSPTSRFLFDGGGLPSSDGVLLTGIRQRSNRTSPVSRPERLQPRRSLGASYLTTAHSPLMSGAARGSGADTARSPLGDEGWDGGTKSFSDVPRYTAVQAAAGGERASPGFWLTVLGVFCLLNAVLASVFYWMLSRRHVSFALSAHHRRWNVQEKANCIWWAGVYYWLIFSVVFVAPLRRCAAGCGLRMGVYWRPLLAPVCGVCFAVGALCVACCSRFARPCRFVWSRFFSAASVRFGGDGGAGSGPRIRKKTLGRPAGTAAAAAASPLTASSAGDGYSKTAKEPMRRRIARWFGRDVGSGDAEEEMELISTDVL